MTAAGVTGLAAWQSGSVEASGVARATLAHPDLLEVLRDEQLVADLGRRYREAVPAENTAAALEAAILGDARPEPSVPPRAWLSQLVQQDFEAGRTVTVNGWVLSVTEARQSALFSLWIA
jgi:hypothetical protein